MLATEGRYIVNEWTGKPVLLRGVNISGMEYSHLPHAGMTPDELRLMIEGWNCDIVRIPFVQSRALAEPEYVEQLRQICSWTWELGAYSILDLQWLDQDSGVPPEPDSDSIQLWDRLSKEFKPDRNIIFDLLNEPHDIPVERWVDWAYLLGSVVRANDPKRVLMIGGMNWAYDLEDVQVNIPNVIYSTHVYRNKGRLWDRSFGNKALEVPVFAGEFGGDDEDLDWGRELLDYFDERRMGWTAWSWRDKPHLQNSNKPTRFGELVRDRLSIGRS